MIKKGHEYLEKLLKAAKEGDPLKMAVITYHTLRESPLAIELKMLNKKEYDETDLSSIASMTGILQRSGWESDDIEKFSEHCKELMGLTK